MYTLICHALLEGGILLLFLKQDLITCLIYFGSQKFYTTFIQSSLIQVIYVTKIIYKRGDQLPIL